MNDLLSVLRAYNVDIERFEYYSFGMLALVLMLSMVLATQRTIQNYLNLDLSRAHTLSHEAHALAYSVVYDSATRTYTELRHAQS